MKRDNITLKAYFETGDYPTETQFTDLIDSFLNIEEEDAVTGIINNGDGTYTFQLLSGGTEVIDVGNLSNNVPISSVVGLQAILDGKVSKSGDIMQGDLELPNLGFSDATTTFIAPKTHDNNILFIGGNGAGDKDWKSIHMYSNGVFRVNDHDIWHAGNDQSLFPFSATELPGGQNLNNYQTAGFYYQTTNSDASSGSNYPPDLRAGSLVVQKSAGVTQQYYTYNDGSPEIWFRAFYPTGSPQWSSWLKIWHSGNDGGGSGLDADTVDGLQASVFVRNDGTSGTRFGGNYLQFNGDGASNNDFVAYNDATNGFYFNADTARQNTTANAGVFAGSFYLNNADTRLMEGGNNVVKIQSPTGYIEIGSKNTSHCHFYTDRSNFYFSKELQVDSGVVRSYNEDLNLNRAGSSTARLRITSGTTYSDQAFSVAGDLSINGSYLNGDGKRMLQYSDSWLRLNPSNNFTSGIYCASSIVRTDNQFQVGGSGSAFIANSNGDVRVSGAYMRTAHNRGYLEGSYNNVGANGAQSNPIYVIGSSYVPNTTSLGNMYGIGYAHGSEASFLNSTDLGTNPANWGLYIAADGNARIFLNATSGIGYFKNVVFASNFILNSDMRIKEEIEDVPSSKMSVRWRKFKMKGDMERFQRYGVIAQELELEHPDFVRTDGEGNKSVAYIDLLVAKNAELEERLEKLEKLIQKLD